MACVLTPYERVQRPAPGTDDEKVDTAEQHREIGTCFNGRQVAKVRLPIELVDLDGLISLLTDLRLGITMHTIFAVIKSFFATTCHLTHNVAENQTVPLPTAIIS